MAKDREREQLRQTAKRMGIEVKRGASKEEIDKAIGDKFLANHEAIRNYPRR